MHLVRFFKPFSFLLQSRKFVFDKKNFVFYRSNNFCAIYFKHWTTTQNRHTHTHKNCTIKMHTHSVLHTNSYNVCFTHKTHTAKNSMWNLFSGFANRQQAKKRRKQDRESKNWKIEKEEENESNVWIRNYLIWLTAPETEANFRRGCISRSAISYVSSRPYFWCYLASLALISLQCRLCSVESTRVFVNYCAKPFQIYH